MALTPDQRETLGKAVKLRRLDLGISIAAAAPTAGMARNTWAGVEDGTRDTSDLTYARVERTLGWKAGSIAAVIDGGQPTIDPSFGRVESGEPGGGWLARLEEIRDNPRLSQPLRDNAAEQIGRLRDLIDAAAAEEDAARRTDT